MAQHPVDPDYVTLARDHAYPWCWACGRGVRDRPHWWNAPWIIQRAHIVSKPRVEDCRVVVLLCGVCHGISHGETFSQVPRAVKLTRANLVWLKRARDPDRYDRAFMQRFCIGKLPRGVSPMAWFSKQYERRR